MENFNTVSWLLLALGVGGFIYALFLALGLFRGRDRRKVKRRRADRREPSLEDVPPEGKERRRDERRRQERRDSYRP